MSPPMITPVAKTLFLCDGYIGFPNQKTNLVGLFNAIRLTQYPHDQGQFVVFAQLIGGLGHVPFRLDVRDAVTDQLVRTTQTQTLHFPHRKKTGAVGLHSAQVPVRARRHLSGRIILWRAMGGRHDVGASMRD